MEAKIAIVPGDGIGREVADQAVKVLRAVGSRFGHRLVLPYALIGQDALQETGNSLPPETVKLCQESQGVLFGAIGGVLGSDTYKKVNTAQSMLDLRVALKLTCNLRPIWHIPALERRSPLKLEIFQGANFVFVREMTGGIIPSRPKGLWQGRHGRYAVNTTRFTEAKIVLAMRVAFELAMSRRRRLAIVAQNPPLEVSRLWRQIAMEMTPQYSQVEVSHWLPDAMAMQIIRDPKGLDVISVDELVTAGILSDAASVIMSSLGMPPSAELQVAVQDGTVDLKHCKGLYQPVHGSVPHRKGKDQVNPCATILSAALLLRHSLDLPHEAQAVEDAVEQVLVKGYRTYDVMEEGCTLVGTSRMGDLVAQQLKRPVIK